MDAATTHVTADSDALASLVALRRLFGGLELVLPGGLESSAQTVWRELEAELPVVLSAAKFLKRLTASPGGTLHVADTASPARLGELADHLHLFDRIVCWDTHPPEPDDLPREDLPLAAASVSPIVLELERRGVVPTPLEAGLFLVGIHEDTHHFTVHETSLADHRAAAACLGWGADPTWPLRYVPRALNSRQLALLERIAESVETIGTGESTIAVATLESERFEPGLATLLGQLRVAEGWRAAFLLASSRGRVDVIARAVPPFDASHVIGRLGGGGHPGAACATLRGETLANARALLLEAIGAARGEGRTAADVAVERFVSVRASDTVRAVADKLHAEGINAVPLVRGRRERRRYVGLVTRREVEAAMRHGLAERPVAEISARPPVWIAPETPLPEIHLALTPGAGRLALVGHPPGDVRGIVTRSTVLLEAGRGLPLASSRKSPSPSSVIALARRAIPDSWTEIENLGKLAEDLGMTLHLVGGSVRDVLAGRPVRDVDLVVEGDGPRLAQEAVRRFGGRRRIHAAFRTATYMPDERAVFDIATARSEFYASPASLPRVEHAGLRRDLMRRDFTINAMALSVGPSEKGRLQDPYGGLEDLKNGVLRVLHGLSFHDDPTRAFRAARFCARFDARLAPETEALIRAAGRSHVFDALGVERLGAELDLILSEREAKQALRLLRDWGLLPRIAKPFRSGSSFFESISSVTASRFELGGIWSGARGESPRCEPADPLWIVLSMATDDSERNRLSRLVPGGARRRALWSEGPERVRRARRSLSRVRTNSGAARVLTPLAPAERVVLLALTGGVPARERILWWEREGRLIELSISGKDLIAAGASPGRALGNALRAAREAAWNGAGAAEQRSAALRILRLDR